MLNTSVNDNAVNLNNTPASINKNNNHTTNNTLGKSAFNALPQAIQTPLKNAKRVVLIANNPSISIETLQEMLQPSDALVLFNHFVHADFFYR